MAVLTDTLFDRVAEIIPRYSMLSQGDRVGVAVSGGADSVALLHILQRLRDAWKIELVVLHVNHHLRGAESEGDEEFVRALAGTLRLEVSVEHAVPAAGNLEQEARLARRKFLLAAMHERRLHRVALGHTRSDQAETVLFRLFRGSGLSGLAGMRLVTDEGFIRPLLTASREEVRRWARQEGLSWREDSSNGDLAFTRNRLRQETMPALAQQYNPALERVLAGTAKLAEVEEDYWNGQVEPVYRHIAKRTQLGSNFQVAAIAALHPAMGRRLVRRAIQGVRGDLRGIELEHVDAVLKLCGSEHGHDRVLIPGLDALRSFGQLLLMAPGRFGGEARGYLFALKFEEKCELPFEAGTIYVNWVKCGSEICANFKKDQEFASEAWDLDGDILSAEGSLDSWYVRNWEPGDQLHLAGHETGEKIKSLFQSHRVLLWERKHWPVVLAGKDIIWTRQFGAAGRYRISGKSRKVVRLTYRASSLSEDSLDHL